MKDEFDYGELGLSAAEITDLQGHEAEIGQLQRRGTEDAFELGEHIDRAADLLDDTRLATWIEARCGMTPRHGRNYRAVYRNLAAHRSRCVSAQIATTTLFKLAAAPGEKVEAVLAAFEAGKRMKGSDVDAILRAEDTAAGELPTVEDRSGLSGLRAFGTDILRHRVGIFAQLCRKVHSDCVIALEPANRGKSINKKGLKGSVQLDARLAYRHLETAVGTIYVPDDWDGTRNFLSLIEPQADSGWGRVSRALYQLGSVGSIGVKELPDLLTNEVLPALRWALGISEEEQTAVLEKAAKAAEITASRKTRAKKTAAEKRKAPSPKAKASKPAAKRKTKITAEQVDFDPAGYREPPMFSTIRSLDAKPAPRGEPNPRAPKLEVISNPEPVS